MIKNKMFMSLRGAIFATWQSLTARLLRQSLCSFLAMTVVLCFLTAGCNKTSKTNRVCYKNNCYAVELAISNPEKEKGLQDRDVLDKNGGMLFAFDGRNPASFWMKKTLIPLDMLWLDYSGQIIYIEHDAPPCEQDPCPLYGPKTPAAYVLEINAGEAARLDMHVGERLDIHIPNSK